MGKKLTPKQEKFIQNIIKGMSQRQAYLNAFPNSKKWKPETVDVKASVLFNSDKIVVRYKELQEAIEKDTIVTARELQKMYSDILRGKLKFKSYVVEDGEVKEVEVPTKLSDWNKTADQLMKLQGEYLDRVELKDSRENTKLDKILEQLEEDNE